MTTAATLQGIPLAGLRLGAPLGSGSGGVVWAATTAEGEQVAVRVLPDLPPEASTARARRLEALRGLSYPGLARVLTMPEDTDERLLVTELVPGPTLPTVRASRMGLPAAEALTLAHDLALALAELHRRGVVHGDVAPENVVLSPVGDDGDARPVLVDLLADPGTEQGSAGFAAPELRAGRRATAASDVWSLGTLCVWASRVGDREQVDRALAAATADDPAARPTAAALAEALADRATAPVQVPPTSVLAGAALREHAQRAPTVLRPTRRPRHRRDSPLPKLVAIAVVLAVLAGGGWAWAQNGPGAGEGTEPTASGRAATGPAQLVEDRVAELVAARDAALVAGDPEALAAVTAPDSPARQQDMEVLAELADSGAALAGLHTAVSGTEVLAATGDSAQVRTELTQSGYERTVDGVTEQVPAQPPRCVELGLTLADGQWLVESVSPCSG